MKSLACLCVLSLLSVFPSLEAQSSLPSRASGRTRIERQLDPSRRRVQLEVRLGWRPGSGYAAQLRHKQTRLALRAERSEQQLERFDVDQDAKLDRVERAKASAWSRIWQADLRLLRNRSVGDPLQANERRIQKFAALRKLDQQLPFLRIVEASRKRDR
jgi:hypothetical protein